MANKRSLGEEEDVEPATWTHSEETTLINLMHKEVEKGNKPKSSFTKKGWANIIRGFHEKTGKAYNFAQFKTKFRWMKKRHFDLLQLLKEPGFSWDPVMGKVIATDDVWISAIEANKNTRRLSKRYPMFNELGVIFGCSTGKPISVAGLFMKANKNTRRLSKRYPMFNEVKHDLEDGSTYVPLSEARGASSEEEDFPSRSVKQRCQQFPSHRNDIHGFQAVEPIALPSRTSDMIPLMPAEFACMEAPQTPSHVALNLQCPFSITNCVKCLDAIEGVPATTYVKALNMFKDADWREMFMAMSAERRLNWLASLE